VGVAVVAAAVYLAVLVANLGVLLPDMQSSSDVVSPMVMAHTISGNLNYGHVFEVQPIYIWFDVATARLPFARELWVALPFALFATTLGLLARTAYRAAGGWAALTTAVMGLCIAPVLFEDIYAQVFHGTTWLGVALLALMAVRWWAQSQIDKTTVRRLFVEAAAVGAVAGIAATSDVYLLVAGLIPFCITVLITRYIAGKSASRFLTAGAVFVAATLVTIALGFLALHLVNFASGLPPAGQGGVASPSQMGKHLSLLINGIADIFYAGNTQTLNHYSLLGPVLALTVVAIFAGVAAKVLRRLVRHRADHSRPDVSTIYLTFWLSCIGIIGAAFIVGDAAVDSSSVRYLLPIPLAFAAVIPVAVGRNLLARCAAAAACGALAIAGAVTISQVAVNHELQPQLAAHTPELIAALAQHNLHYGYAEYWMGSQVTWRTNSAVTIRPITERDLTCHSICRSRAFTVGSWYSGKNGKSFVVINPFLIDAPSPPGRQFGTPVDSFAVGNWTVYVYDYDVAQEFDSYCQGPPSSC